MKPIHEPRLTEFEGWANDMEYLADEQECKRRNDRQIRQFNEQMREQRQAKVAMNRNFVLGALAGTCLVLAGYLFVILWMSL